LNGTTKNGVQKYKCKNCKRYFSDKPRKFNYEDKERAVNMVMNNCGIRKTAIFIGCSPYMVLRWKKEQAKYLKEEDLSSKEEVIEMDEVYTKVKKTEI
jgi:transposase-like protein